jgi:SulP family sulfate permease
MTVATQHGDIDDSGPGAAVEMNPLVPAERDNNHRDTMSVASTFAQQATRPRKHHDETPAEKVKRLAVHTAYTLLPPLSWIPNYRLAYLPRDIIGGLLMGVMCIPMCLGYAALVGIPLQMGLYSASIYSGVYFFFGNVGALSMGPVAELTFMLMSEKNLPSDPTDRAKTVQLIAFQCGIFSLALCLFKGGEIVRNSFARAIGDANSAAAGIVLIFVQLSDAFNFKSKKTALLHESIENLINGFKIATLYNLYAFLVFGVLFAYLMVMKKIPKMPSWVPHQLFVVVVAIIVSWLARLDQHIHLNIVKDVPSTFPDAGIPAMNHFSDVLVTSIVITLVAFLQMYSIATRVSTQVNANPELFATGCCALAAGFLGGMPGSASWSRAAVMEDVKVKSTLSSLITALFVFISAVGLTRVGTFYYLPKGALAAVIVAAATKLVDFTHAVWLFKHFKVDFLVWFTTFILTMFLGVQYGVLSGIGLSIVIVLFRVGMPKTYTLAYDPLNRAWVDARGDDELLVHREVHVWCYDSPLYFVNVHYVSETLQHSMEKENRRIQVIVIDCTRIRDIDASSVERLRVAVEQLPNSLRREGSSWRVLCPRFSTR